MAFSWDTETVIEEGTIDEKSKFTVLLCTKGKNEFVQYIPENMTKEGWKKGTYRTVRLDELQRINTALLNKGGNE